MRTRTPVRAATAAAAAAAAVLAGLAPAWLAPAAPAEALVKYIRIDDTGGDTRGRAKEVEQAGKVVPHDISVT
jgi:hypothetical protein